MMNSGALKRLVMLDMQRIEDKTLLQLPRLNTVSTILEVYADRELPQVLALCACSVPLCDHPLQLLRKNYSHVIEVGDDGWEYACMICGSEKGELMVCESKPQCTKVAHAACAYGKRAPPKHYVCSAHTAPIGTSINKSQVSYRSSL